MKIAILAVKSLTFFFSIILAIDDKNHPSSRLSFPKKKIYPLIVVIDLNVTTQSK
jgi:hypothetical protein